MKTIGRTIPIAQLLLIFPAVLFMISLVVRSAGPTQFEPAQMAQQIVLWYSGRVWTLWVLLMALPLAVLGIGCLVLLGQWTAGPRRLVAAIRSNGTTMLIAILTLVSGVILLIVAAHVVMN